MRIVALIQCANLGGMEQSALLLLDELKHTGHDAELISLNQMGSLQPLLQQRGIPATAVGYRGKWGWRSFFPLRRLLRSKKADALIMIGHNLMAMLALGSFCRERRVLSLHFHHQGVMSVRAWRMIYRVALWRFNHFIYPSRFILDEALAITPGLKSVHTIISYPIPVPEPILLEKEAEIRAQFCKRHGLSPRCKLVGNAGWLISRKRWDVFLQVSAKVAATVPDARFLIAGDGPELGMLKQLAAKLQLTDRVIWLGWQNDLADFYRALDVMLFNSDWDAMGRTPLEAMSYAKPVVASMLHGGLREILNSEKYGFLTDTHDVPLLAGKVTEFLMNQKLAAEVGANARRLVSEVGSPQRHAERVLGLLNGKRTGGGWSAVP